MNYLFLLVLLFVFSILCSTSLGDIASCIAACDNTTQVSLVVFIYYILNIVIIINNMKKTKNITIY